MSGHDHQHCHGHHHRLDWALGLTAVFALVEFAGGWLANSLALLADAVHMVSDVAALGVAAIAGRVASRPAHAGMTYGYGRARVLAAQINGVALFFLSGWIVWEAFGRMQHVPEVEGGLVIAIGGLGLLINLIILKWLHGSHDINTRAAYWHVLGDTMGSVAAMVAGIVILATGWMLIDPLLSLLVAAILGWGGWRLVRETTRELMEGAPDEIDADDIMRVIRSVDGVVNVHHLHLWKLPDGRSSLSAHIDIATMDEWVDLCNRLQQGLSEQGVVHVTLQPELADERCDQHSCNGAQPHSH